MTDGYTPTERQMETAWCEYAHAVDASAGRLREDDEDPSGEYARFIAKVKADAWDEGAARARGDMEAELAAANPYKKEVAQ